MRKFLTGIIVGILVLAMIPFSAFAETNTVEADNQATIVSETEDVLLEQEDITSEQVEDSDEIALEEEQTLEAENDAEESTEVAKEANELEAEADLEAPTLTSAGNVANGIRVMFDSVSGASNYKIYRKTSEDETFKEVATTDETEYTDTDVETGKEYCYTVSALNGSSESSYDEDGLSVIYVPVTQIKTLENVNGKLKITWEKVSGVEGYLVYIREKGGSFSSGKKVVGESNTSYNYKVSASGDYEFVVRPYISSDTTVYKSWWEESYVKSIKFLSTPKFKVAVATNGNKITVTKDSKAKYYLIYRKVNNGKKWKYIGKTTKASYTDKKTKNGKKYTYTVKSETSDKIQSSYNTTGKTVVWLSPVKIKKISSNGIGVALKWKKVKGAQKYIIYRKTASGDYKKVKATKKLTFSDKTVASKTTYRYAVVAVKKVSGKTYKSAYTKKYTKKIKTVTICKDRMTKMANNYSSSSRYLILVDCQNNYLGVFEGSQGNWSLKYYWRCTTGAPSSPTVKGVYQITGNRGYSFGEDHGYSCYYYSGFYGGYLIHSTKFVPGTFKDLDARLGVHVSGGCVRLYIDNAKWIYYNVPTGTTVVTYK